MYPQRLDDRTPLSVACTYLPLAINERTRWLEDQQKTKIIKLLSLNSDCTLTDKVTCSHSVLAKLSPLLLCTCIGWQHCTTPGHLTQQRRMCSTHSQEQPKLQGHWQQREWCVCVCVCVSGVCVCVYVCECAVCIEAIGQAIPLGTY